VFLAETPYGFKEMGPRRCAPRVHDGCVPGAWIRCGSGASERPRPGHPPATRIRAVVAAAWAISTTGATLAIWGAPWCSANHARRGRQGFFDPLRTGCAAHAGDRQIDAFLGNFVDLVLWPLGDPNGWNPDLVADTESVRCINPAAIHPHFAATQNPVDMALRNPLAAPDQKVVEALPLFFFADHRVRD